MFKSLTVYKIADVLAHEKLILLLKSKDELSDFLLDNQPEDPVAEQVMRCGYETLDPLTIELVTTGTLNHCYLPLTMVIRQRAIDNGAVNLATARRVAKIQAEESRIVGKKEKVQIKNEVLFEMIPKAPIKEKRVRGFVTGLGRIMIDATGKAAEEYVSFLREKLDGLPALPVTIETADDFDNVSDLIHAFVVKSIENEYFDVLGEKDEYKYQYTGSFAFMSGDEQITIKNCKAETMTPEFFSGVKNGHTMWCDFENAEVEFRLLSDLSFKALKFTSDFELDEEGDANKSVGIHRVEMRSYTDLLVSVIGEIVKTHIGDNDE